MESRLTLDAYTFQSELGWMALAWKDEKLFALVFGQPTRSAAEKALRRNLASHQLIMSELDSNWADDLIEQLQKFAAGEPVDFDDVEIDVEHLTPFGRRVTEACRAILRGETKSYGRLATECRRPGAARAVGTVMAKNRFPLIVPCHRVVGSGGGLGGYSAPQGLRMKRRLLDMECSRELVGT